MSRTSLSLSLQTVNQLPWYLEEIIAAKLAMITLLASDLRSGNIRRSLPATERSQGQPVPAFEFLTRHLSEIRKLMYSLFVETLGRVASIDLDPSPRRRTRAANPFQTARDTAADRDVGDEVKGALTDLAELASSIVGHMTERLKPPPREAERLKRMSACLDLRAMAFNPAYGATAKAPLELLWRWLCSRSTGVAMSALMQPQRIRDLAGGAPRPQVMDTCTVDMFVTVWAQFEILSGRLHVLSTKHPYATRWKDASGTVIMGDVFTTRSLYDGCGLFLYLFQHCASKTMCEAVVEGMGSVWDASSGARRHQRFEVSVKEAVIAWTAPQPYQDVANPFLTAALNRHFNGKPWNFVHTDMRLRQKHFDGGSKVIARHRKDPLRMPSSFYG